MSRFFSYWRFILGMGSILWGLMIALPSFLPPQYRSQIPSWLPQKPITLGLDLQGGVHLVLEVDVNSVIKEHHSQSLDLLRKKLRKEGLFPEKTYANKEGIWICLTHNQEKNIKELFSSPRFEGFEEYEAPEEKPESTEASSLEKPEGFSEKTPEKSSEKIFLVLKLLPKMKRHLIQQAVQKSLETIRKRIDKTGALEPTIQTQGEARIILQIPGFDDPARVHALLGKTAKLTFQWVSQPGYDKSFSKPLMLPYGLNDGTKEGEKNETIEEKDSPSPSTIPVLPEILLSGEDVLQARVIFSGNTDQMMPSLPAVQLTLTQKGTRIFSELTQNIHRGRSMAIVLDNRVLSAPTINDHIEGGRAQITGMKTMEEAQQLALMINSGALPAPLKILEEKVVGPQLGRDSIIQGTQGTLLSIGAVIVWMFCIYSGFGIFAVMGVLGNLCFLFAALVWLNATLTLPGLAGIALTVGMSVDANVLINERIKEERRRGLSIAESIASGYAKARGSIMDSNLTTLVGSFILYCTGTGPVRGFAVTMGLGILISLFTAIGLTAMIVRGWIAWFKPKNLWI